VVRENYTVELAGFDDAVRSVVTRAVKGSFTKIGRARLENYLNLKGSRILFFSVSVIESKPEIGSRRTSPGLLSHKPEVVGRRFGE
jgi:hypothetical protein